MVIDNLTATSVYFEKMTTFLIECNNSINNNNVLEKDKNGNSLIGLIDTGDSKIKLLKKYEGDNYVLFHNRYDNNIRMVKQGEEINMFLDFVYGTKFYTDAKKCYGSNIIGTYKFELDNDISNDNIFKIFLDNGKEINNYEYDNDDNTVIIKGLDTLYIEDFSEIILYTYNKNQSYDLQIEYIGYRTIFDMSSFLNEEYFNDDFNGGCLECFESCEISQDVAQDSYKYSFRTSSKKIINLIKNNMSFDIFLGNEYIDIVKYIGYDEFRFIFVNPLFGKIIIVNNCKIDNGVSIVFEKEKNKKRFDVSCSNYIEITSSAQSYYGMGSYGKGKYGGDLSIYNSSRR